MLHTKDLFSGGKTLDEKSLDMLAKVIEQNNLPGFDYYEFKRSVTMLQQMALDEPTAFKSAFQTASTVGVTKEKLLETAQYYRNLMEKEQSTFSAALETQSKKRITDRQTEIQRLKDQITRHEEQLTRLQEEIAAYKNDVTQAEQQITTDTEKLATTQAAFGTTLQAILFTIDSDLEKIHQHLA
jgi:predicted  nucleic acid-binding Zn-ribbon protein